MACRYILVCDDAGYGVVAAGAKTEPVPSDRADDPIGHEGDQNHEHQAENEFPQIANGRYLLQHVAQDEPDRRADGRADQRSRSADHRLDDKLTRGVQRKRVRRHIALEDAEQGAATACEHRGEREHGEFVRWHIVAQGGGALRILADRRQNGAHRRQHDKTREHKADEKESRN